MTMDADLLLNDTGKLRGSVFITAQRVRCHQSGVGLLLWLQPPSRTWFGVWLMSLKLFLLQVSQKHRWWCGSLIISVWRLKGGWLGEEGRERTRDGKSEFSRRASHHFIFFPQPLLMARVMDSSFSLQKILRGFPGILKCGGLCAQPVTTPATRMDLS